MKNIILFALFSILAIGGEEKKTANDANDRFDPDKGVYFPVDWRNIKPDERPIPGFVHVEGYLELQGTGDFPQITLWETDEARKQHMIFRNLLVQSESAAPLIIKHFGAGVDSWRVLQGMFVSIDGILEIEPRESRHLFIGTLKSIKSIVVKNKGSNLLEIK